jgi:large subunit ribosomal protein L6
MAEGVTTGYRRDLEIQGVGFKASLSGRQLTLNVGYSHPVDYTVPDGVTVEVVDGTQIKVSGIDKQLVGQVSARIRSFRPPEPYKGKGVRYKDERVRRKAGKTVA